jgi:hypothetical protein
MRLHQCQLWESWEQKQAWLDQNCRRCYWHDRCDAEPTFAEGDMMSELSPAVVELVGFGEQRRPWEQQRPCRQFVSGEVEAWKQGVINGSATGGGS